MKDISVIIVDDHKLFREGIELVLSTFSFVKSIYTAANGKEYLDMLENVKPNIVLMDINMPIIDGVEATKISKEKYPEIKIIALTMHESVDYYMKMTEIGVDGFITKDTNKLELENALITVGNNKTYFSRIILDKVLNHLHNNKTNNTAIINFSKREEEILAEMFNGYSNQEIADKLFISRKTVERHKENMCNKSNTKSSISLVLLGIKQGILQI